MANMPSENSTHQREQAIEKPKRKRTPLLFSAAYFFIIIALTIFYQLIGDTTPIGEYVTVWPPILWLFGLIPLLFIGLLITLKNKRDWKLGLILTVGLCLYLFINIELWPVLKVNIAKKPERRAGTIRLLTWNINSMADWQLLPILEKYNPDICLFQESPSGDLAVNSEDLVGRWEGYHINDDGELFILSRFPLQALPSEPVGPWSPPQVVKISAPEIDFILCNVRLMLPSLRFAVWEKETRIQFIAEHEKRIVQFPRLASQLKQISREIGLPFILAGDINTAAHAKSLDPLREISTDAWREAGNGWGRTMTANFPVARIDQCWLSAGLQAIHAEVHRETRSDHRLLIVDFSPSGKAPNLR